MIRLTFMLRRKPEMSRAEFQKYWRENHGPLVAGRAHHLNILRYVQVHTLEEDEARAAQRAANPRGKMEEPYDGVAELWWWRREGFVAANSTPEGQAAAQELVEDEAKFIDLPNSPLWLAYEYPQINPAPENLVATEMSSLVKHHYPLRHLTSLTLDEAQLYWRTNHGPIIRLNAPGTIKRYVQVHRFEDELEGQLREARGTAVEPYTGHAELWVERSARTLGTATPEAIRFGQLAYEDETNFIDFARSTTFDAKEHVFVDHR
jgi:hypothetical protein